jgi:hypothetical protein
MRRMMRRWWPDRNPLRRTADRVEAIIIAVLVIVFLAGVPLAVLAAAGKEAAGGRRTERAEEGWRQVPAVLMQDAPGPAHARSQASLEPLVRARWTAPSGAQREGQVYAPTGARSGTSVLVWTDESGDLEGAPLERGDLTTREVLMGAAAAALAAAALAIIGVLACAVLDRRRAAAWDAEWSRTGPQWTGRL